MAVMCQKDVPQSDCDTLEKVAKWAIRDWMNAKHHEY